PSGRCARSPRLPVTSRRQRRSKGSAVIGSWSVLQARQVYSPAARAGSSGIAASTNSSALSGPAPITLHSRRVGAAARSSSTSRARNQYTPSVISWNGPRARRVGVIASPLAVGPLDTRRSAILLETFGPCPVPVAGMLPASRGRVRRSPRSGIDIAPGHRVLCLHGRLSRGLFCESLDLRHARRYVRRNNERLTKISATPPAQPLMEGRG